MLFLLKDPSAALGSVLFCDVDISEVEIYSAGALSCETVNLRSVPSSVSEPGFVI